MFSLLYTIIPKMTKRPHNDNNTSNSTTTTPASNSKSDPDLEFQRRNKLWVVLVDDEESIRFAVGDFLYDRGYEVTACADAKSLLDLIVVKNKSTKNQQKQPRLPDLIISDVRMPESDKNGYELVQFLRSADTSIEGSPLNQQSLASLRNLPIMLLTAKAMTEDRIMGYKAGADVVLPKPFSPEELVSIIDGLILRRHQRLSPKKGQPQQPLLDSAPTSASENLRSLKREIDEIKAIVQQNAATTVQKTDVVLTDKERKIVELLSKGYTLREIASEINNNAKPQLQREEASDLRVAFISQQQLFSFNHPYQLGWTGKEVDDEETSFKKAHDSCTTSIHVRRGDIIIMATDGCK